VLPAKKNIVREECSEHFVGPSCMFFGEKKNTGCEKKKRKKEVRKKKFFSPNGIK